MMARGLGFKDGHQPTLLGQGTSEATDLVSSGGVCFLASLSKPRWRRRHLPVLSKGQLLNNLDYLSLCLSTELWSQLLLDEDMQAISALELGPKGWTIHQNLK